MITDDKTITTPDYWNKIYSGNNDNAAVDASNTKRPPNPFDRFSWVAKHAEGTAVLGIASGHAHIEKLIKAAHNDWNVIASDQADLAAKASGFKPYRVINAYSIPFIDKAFDTIICTQAMEYMDDQEKFLLEARRVSKVLLLTVPIGEMLKWSQLRIYSEENIKALLEPMGTIEVFEREGDLLLVKLKFND